MISRHYVGALSKGRRTIVSGVKKHLLIIHFSSHNTLVFVSSQTPCEKTLDGKVCTK